MFTYGLNVSYRRVTGRSRSVEERIRTHSQNPMQPASHRNHVQPLCITNTRTIPISMPHHDINTGTVKPASGHTMLTRDDHCLNVTLRYSPATIHGVQTSMHTQTPHTTHSQTNSHHCTRLRAPVTQLTAAALSCDRIMWRALHGESVWRVGCKRPRAVLA